MTTGLNTQLIRQVGEHLVTAELGRRGIIASPFAGNVPDIDILGFANGVSAPLQVKAIKGDSWQFDIRYFLDVTLGQKGQKIHGPNTALDRNIICVFVGLGNGLGNDEFYVFRLGWLQDYFMRSYEGRKPPKNYRVFPLRNLEARLATTSE
jgi:hypothetical protein